MVEIEPNRRPLPVPTMARKLNYRALTIQPSFLVFQAPPIPKLGPIMEPFERLPFPPSQCLNAQNTLAARQGGPFPNRLPNPCRIDQLPDGPRSD